MLESRLFGGNAEDYAKLSLFCVGKRTAEAVRNDFIVSCQEKPDSAISASEHLG
jgi:hypothetical protein